ncbi:hypothetical protein [Streptomyces sp. NPDC024089]|uniref:hypothetical protein n=1 Tax=Streptomyces sp. NPDC024089 TaxID=3154328 RepID=UPI0033F3AED9
MTTAKLLTRRQREVLLLAANGNTVNETLVRAYRALGVHDRAQAVAVALKVGEFGLDDIHVPITEQQPTT